MSQRTIFAVIPARSGSKGIPNKNLVALRGRSLLARAIAVSRESLLINRICVSTDSELIRLEAEKFGVSVPWLRSEALASDTASTAETVIDATIREIGRPSSGDIIVLLEPTAPLRTSADLDNVITFLIDNWEEFDCCVTITRANFHPSALHKFSDNSQRLVPYFPDPQGVLNRRQDGEQAFLPIGSCFAIKAEVLLREKSFYVPRLGGVELERSKSIEVDDLVDLVLADALMDRLGP